MRNLLPIALITTSIFSTSAFASDWYVSYTNDEMRNTSTKFMGITSTNTEEFDFPYQGGSKLLITLRSDKTELKPDQKPSDLKLKEAMVIISKGMFTCQSYDNCFVSAKFDSNPIEKYTVLKPTDHSSNVFFIKNEKKFIKQIMESKKLIIEATFYKEGSKQFKFNLEGFDQPNLSE